MNQIAIGFSTPKSFKLFPWAIRKVLNTPYSHVYICFYSSAYERAIVYQASGFSVNMLGRARFDLIETVVAEFELPVSDELQKKIIQTAIDTCGKPYGTLHIIGLVIYLVAKKCGLGLKAPPFLSTTTEICSQLGAEILKELSQKYSAIDPTTATPFDVFNILNKDA